MPELIIRTMTGRFYKYDINNYLKIIDLKKKISSDFGTPILYQYLSHNGRILKNDDYIYDYFNTTKQQYVLYLVNRFLGA